MERGKLVRVENVADTSLTKLSEFPSPVISNLHSIYPQYDMMKRELHLSGFLPQTHSPSLIMRKISDKPRLRDILQNTSTAQVVKSMKKKE